MAIILKYSITGIKDDKPIEQEIRRRLDTYQGVLDVIDSDKKEFKKERESRGWNNIQIFYLGYEKID